MVIKLTALCIRECCNSRQQPSHSRPMQNAPIQEKRGHPNRAFTHMHQPLSYPHHEQAIRFLCVVIRKLSEHLCESGVVRACADETHREDGVERDGEVVVVAVFGECVHDGELRIGDGDETEC